MKSTPRVVIIILNWNGWQDTIECLESVFRCDYPHFRVIVCDNDSSDGSMERIRQWAVGLEQADVPADHPLRHLSNPPIAKPIRYVEYDRDTAELGGSRDDDDARLILIRTGGNLGFAGGTNVGLRYALARDDFEYAWLLNNDTVVEPDALSHMTNSAMLDKSIGMLGATVLFYLNPGILQAMGGGTYNRLLGTVKLNGWLRPVPHEIHAANAARRLDFIAGSCMFVSKSALKDVGLISEDYFLYYEEIDWGYRARGLFRLGYAPEARVYHKLGRSISSGGCEDSEKSLLSDYYLVKNRLVIARKYHPHTLPSVYLGLIVTMLNRIQRRQWDRLPLILRLILGFRCSCPSRHKSEY